MTDPTSAPAETQLDIGRVDVPGVTRDAVVSLRSIAHRLDRTLNAHWTTLEKRNAAEDDLLQMAEMALAAHRSLRAIR